ncbi:MAG: winged-helix domain-containing protein, partial [Actinomycetes bacterium]
MAGSNQIREEYAKVQQNGRYGTDAARPVEAEPSSPHGALPAGLSAHSPVRPNGSVSAARTRVRAVPEAAVGRLAIYLQVLTSLIEQGVRTVS